MSWWLAPGIAVFGVSIVLTVVNLARGLVRRPRLQLWLKTVFLRRVGIGLLLVGLGIGWMLPALGRGPDLGGLILGALGVGMGGLYFISVTDPMFEGCRSLTAWGCFKSGTTHKDPAGDDERGPSASG